jgi:hypothetical protein
MDTIPDFVKEAAVAALHNRRENRPVRIDNAALYAGSDMFYYCTSCGHVSDQMPETWFLGTPRSLCTECQALKDLDLLE